jgi:hypothetical protein
MDKYFLVQIKRTNDTIDKGVVIKDTLESAKQSYHAYLGAYAYGNHAQTDYVAVYIVDAHGVRLIWEVWEKVVQPEPEEEEPTE